MYYNNKVREIKKIISWDRLAHFSGRSFFFFFRNLQLFKSCKLIHYVILKRQVLIMFQTNCFKLQLYTHQKGSRSLRLVTVHEVKNHCVLLI